jgi:hypothetical protein
MGYETYWLDDNDDISNFDFSNSIFLSEEQSSKKMPLRKDCKYILHHIVGNDNTEKYNGLNCVNLNVFNKKCLNFEKINDYTFIDKGNFLYQPWATDLLPQEINLNDINFPREDNIYFIGSVSTGWNDIFKECTEFTRAAKTKNLNFIIKGGYTGSIITDLLKCEGGFVSVEDSINFIKKSYFSPIFQSIEQREMQYIPCRIFKNISYGQYPITNCNHLNFIFPDKLIYNENTYDLFFDAERKKNKEILKELMNEVKEKHTFINRINQILKIL